MKTEELIQLLDSYMVDYAETEDNIYIIMENNQIKIDKKSGQSDNKKYPTIESLIKEIGEW